MHDVPLYICCGGHSTRFGSDKARALLDGKPLLVDVHDRLAPYFVDVTLVADRMDRYADLLPTTRCITDTQADTGPLAALHAALVDASIHQHDHLFLVACDLVRPQPAWADVLIDARQPQDDVVAFRGTYWEPLFALYATRLLPMVEAQLAEGRRALHHLLHAVNARALALPTGLQAIPQANTPDALPV